MLVRRFCLVAAVCAAVLVGCDDGGETKVDSTPPDMAPACEEGAVEECEVSGGCMGTRMCVSGEFTACAGEDEICDGDDNDCDGVADEEYTQLGLACEVGEGACTARGTYICAFDGSGELCNALAGAPGDETCNGADDDCDGVTDEGPRVGVPCGGGRFYDAACNCVRNDFVGGWFNRYSCGGVQDGWDDEEHDMIAEGEYSHFECGVICTNAGVACCAARAGNCYEGSPDYWWVWPELTGWWSSRRGGGIPADVRE